MSIKSKIYFLPTVLTILVGCSGQFEATTSGASLIANSPTGSVNNNGGSEDDITINDPIENNDNPPPTTDPEPPLVEKTCVGNNGNNYLLGQDEVGIFFESERVPKPYRCNQARKVRKCLNSSGAQEKELSWGVWAGPDYHAGNCEVVDKPADNSCLIADLAAGQVGVKIIKIQNIEHLCVNSVSGAGKEFNPYFRPVRSFTRPGGIKDSELGKTYPSVSCGDRRQCLALSLSEFKKAGNYYIQAFHKLGITNSQSLYISPRNPVNLTALKEKMGGRELAILDPKSFLSLRQIKPGKIILVALNTKNMTRFKNKYLTISATAGHSLRHLTSTSHSRQQDLKTLVKIKMHGDNEWVNTNALGEKVLFKLLTIPKDGFDYVDMSGEYQVGVDVNRSTDTSKLEKLTYKFSVLDSKIPEIPTAARPITSKTVGLFYYGSSYSIADLESLRAKMEREFVRSTKGYMQVKVNLVGRKRVELPLQVQRDYVGWWNKQDHSQCSSQRQLNISNENSDDFRALKSLWYYYNGKLGITLTEIRKLYPRNSDGEDLTIYLTDANIGDFNGLSFDEHEVIMKTFSIGNWKVGKSLCRPGFMRATSLDLATNIGIHEAGHSFFHMPDRGSEGIGTDVETRFNNFFHEHYQAYSRDRNDSETTLYYDEVIQKIIDGKIR